MIIITSNYDGLSLATIAKAHVILELDSWPNFYFIHKDKVHGHHGSLLKELIFDLYIKES